MKQNRCLAGLVVLVMACWGTGLRAAVQGRYIYFGNALSERMGLVEVEVYSGGKNVLQGRPEVFTHGLEYGYWMRKRSPEDQARMARLLTDGDTDTTQRKVDFGSKVSCGYGDLGLRYTSLGIDLGEEIPVERIGIYRSRWEQKQHNDLGHRILVVMNAKREIVSWKAFNVYGDGWKKTKGVWMQEMDAAQGSLRGRVVPAGARCWLSEAEYIRDCLGRPEVDLVKEITPELAVRLKRFEERNTPTEIERLGREFFMRVDLTNPDLAAVKSLVDAGRYAAALAAFKKPFFAKLEPLKYWNAGEGTSIYVFYSWTAESDTRSQLRARDLRNHVYGDKRDLEVRRFRPGTLPPAKIQFPFQTRSLLLNYAVNDNKEDLRLWEALTDDWGMGFQEAADQDPQKLRDHFVLSLGLLPKTCKDLYMASVTNPAFVEEVSGATIARLLLPMLEELPVSYWRVTRKCVFNHNFNAIGGAYRSVQVLPYFLAVKRLERETRQALQRLHTLALYRDGEMIEIGDEGHFVMPICSPGNLYGMLVRDKPAWFDPAVETYFLDHFRQAVLAGVRHVSPSGISTRWGNGRVEMGHLGYYLGTVDPYWRNVVGMRNDYGDGTPMDYDTHLAQMVMREAGPRAVVDTVYGRGRSFENRNRKREQEKVAEVYGGEYAGAPSFLSDWMPYSGLHYFRGGWDSQAPFLHMVSPSNPNSNEGGPASYNLISSYTSMVKQFATTSYRFYDYGTPILTGHGILVDGLPACGHERRFPSGSKQNCFTQGVEKPQSGRWFSDEKLDFGEAGYHGTFREADLAWNPGLRETYVHLSDVRVEDVDSTRQIFQVRPARLFLQVDRVRHTNPEESHKHTVKSTLIMTVPAEETGKELSNDQVELLTEKRRAELRNPGNAGATLAWFGQPDLAFSLSGSANHPDLPKLGGPSMTFNGSRKTKGRELMASWTARGETVLLSLLRGLKPDENPIASLEDLSDEHVTGLRATMTDEVKVTLLVARKIPAELSVGRVAIRGEALLLCESPGKPPMGLALGARGVKVDGRRTKVWGGGDFRFTIGKPRRFLGVPRAADLAPVAIHRPIDPPEIAPDLNTFVDSAKVTITSQSPDVDIYYLAEPLEGIATASPAGGLARASVKVADWKLYKGSFTIRESTFVRAYAQRKGTEREDFVANGVNTSSVSYGRFVRRSPKPALAESPAGLQSGLDYEYLEDRWFALWTYTDQLAPKTTGSMEALLDVSMRQTDGPFAVRYKGYLDVPEDGIYTFFAPDELVNNTCAPGYDLRLFIDGEEWDLCQIWHARGQWSVPLEKGLHSFRVTFADARNRELEGQRIDLWRHYPWVETTWKGVAPVIEVAGPRSERQPLPTAWLKRK